MVLKPLNNSKGNDIVVLVKTGLSRLTHFQAMLDLCRNQAVGFYYQNV